MPENLPAGDLGMGPKNDFSAQTQNDFSSNMRHDEEDFDDHAGGNSRQEHVYQKQSLDDEYAPIRTDDHDDIGHLPAVTPTSPLNQNGLGIHDYNTSYNASAYNPSAYSSTAYTGGGGGFPHQSLTMPEPRR